MDFKFALIIFFVATSLFINGQTDSTSRNKNEVNIVLEDIFAKNFYYPSPAIYSYDMIEYGLTQNNDIIVPKIGLGYKYHFSKFAIRTKANVGYKENSNKPNNNSLIKNDFSLTQIGSHVGIEMLKKISKAHFFYGIDFIFNYYKQESEFVYQNESSVNNENKTITYGLAPLLGIKYFLNQNISFSTELRYSILKYSSENIYKNTYYDNRYSITNYENKSEDSGLMMHLGPLGQLSVNFHF